MKTRMKQLISLLCVVTVFASTVLSTDFLSAKAETNSGQVEEKLPTDMTEISFYDFGYEDGDYGAGTVGKQYSGTTMDDTLFSGKVIFPKAADVFLQYGGKVQGGGFNLGTVEKNGTWYLCLSDTNQDGSGVKFSYELDPNVAGVPLVGTELELNISMEYVNLDDGDTRNDLKLGIWFGKKLYNNEYYFVNNYVDTGHSIGTWMNFSVSGTEVIKIKSCNYQLPTDMTEISFRDFGIKDNTYTKWGFKSYSEETMDNTLFSGTITFPQVAGAYFTYAGNGGQVGLGLYVVQSKTGEWNLELQHTNKKLLTNQVITAAAAGVDQLVGVPLELHISMKYVNLDEGATNNDLKLGIWFGDHLYQDEYIYMNNYVGAERTGNVLTYSPKTEMALKSSDIKLPTGMKEITFRDFDCMDGADYTGFVNKGKYEGETLNGTLFSGKITFPEVSNVCFQYGGKTAGGGFNLATAQNQTTKEWYLRLYDTNQDKSNKGPRFSYDIYSSAADVPLVGEELDLKLTVEYVSYDTIGTNNDVKLGVWFNNKLYQNNFYYLNNYVDTGHSMGTWLNFYVGNQVKLAIKSVGKINWKPLPSDMTEISFRDFGFLDGAKTAFPEGSYYEGETLNGTLFNGKITFPKVNNISLQYGGKTAGGGFNLATAQNEETGEWYLRLYDTNQDKSNKGPRFSYDLYSQTAETTLVGEELDLNISIEFVNRDGGETDNDVKLGLWFNGKLYSNCYFYLENYADIGHSIGNWMNFYVTVSTNIYVKSAGTINWKNLPQGMKHITFYDFGFVDGDYTSFPAGSRYEGGTLEGTIFSGKITFPESKDVFLQYGGKKAGGGFNLGTSKNEETGEWELRLYDTNQDKSTKGPKFNYYMTSDVAETKLVGEEIGLNISIEYVDRQQDGVKNDVKVGLWFNGKLYNNCYLYLKDFADTGYSMGPWMNFYVSKNTSLNIKSVGEIKSNPLPTGLKELGFSDFGIASGVYEGATKAGEYEDDSLKNTLFSGIVKWDSEVGETHFIYGGGTDSTGIDLMNGTDETTGEHYLCLYYVNPQEVGNKLRTYWRFYSDVAGVKLVDNEIDLKISFEFVNEDGGKAKDDAKIGIWFDGQLYGNRYIYINNYEATGHVLKNKLTIWNRNGAAFGVGRQSDWLDWSAFGLTANWKKTLLDTDFNLKYALAGGNPYTGDETKIPYVAMGVSIAVIVLCGCQIVRRRREDYDIQG